MPPGWPGRGRDDVGAQAGEVRVAVGHDGRHAVQRAAQDHDDEAPVGRRGGQRERGAAEGEGGGQARAARSGGSMSWRVGMVIASGTRARSSSSVSASRREPARCICAERRGRAAAGRGRLGDRGRFGTAAPARRQRRRPSRPGAASPPAPPSRRRGRASRSATGALNSGWPSVAHHAVAGPAAGPAGRSSARMAAST